MILRESGRMVKLFHRKNCNFSFIWVKKNPERKSRQTRMIFNRPVLDFAPDFSCLHADLFKEQERSDYFSHDLKITDDNWFQCIVFRLEAEDAFFFVKSFDSSTVIE